MTRHADVHEHTVKSTDAGFLHDLREVSEITAQSAEARRIRFQPFRGMTQSRWILIHGHHTRTTLEQRFGMTTST